MAKSQQVALTTESSPEFSDAQAGPCPICGDHKTRTIRFPDHLQPFANCPPWHAHDKYYCPACHHLWSARFKELDLSAYGLEYVKANTDAQRVPNERMSASPKLLELLIAWTKGNRFLDCGVGYNTPYIEQVRSGGIDLWGCDISAAIPYDEHVVRLPCDLPKLGRGTFDGIFSQDVVEHFNNPVEDYGRLRLLLRPGGLLLSSTPVLEKIWDGSEPIPRHLWLWTPWHTSICSSRSMAMLARQAGLEFVSTESVPTETGWAFLLRRPDEDPGP